LGVALGLDGVARGRELGLKHVARQCALAAQILCDFCIVEISTTAGSV
jgi:hypothetical protein